ncbi:hypothetical protein [Streptomyces sp. NPDC002758]
MPKDTTKSAAEAHKAAMKHVEMLMEASGELRQMPKVDRYINGMKRGIPFDWDLQDHMQYSIDTLSQVGDLIGEIAVAELWKENGRVCYDLHPELADALYRSKMNAVPGDLFNRLPHINPMIVFPEAWPIADGKMGTAYVRCVFVVGWNGNALCNTNDPDREGHALLFCYNILNDAGEEVPGGARDLIPLPTSLKKFTVREAIEFAGRWHQGKGMDNDTRKVFQPLLEKTFSVITYLCTDNRDVDMQEPPAWTQQRRKKTGKGRKAPDREPFWVRVGWYVGPKLHDARLRAATVKRDGISVPSGVEYGPQHRSGHFKTVWIGPGKSGQRTQSTTTWVEPYWTKLEDLPEDMDPPTQVVPVGPQRKDPLRRRKTIGR